MSLSLAAVLLLAAAPAPAAERVLASVPEGWSLDDTDSGDMGAVPRIAWSPGLDTVVFVARKESSEAAVVNGAVHVADRVDEAMFTRDGTQAVLLLTRGGRQHLIVGEKSFGPFDTIELPALSADGSFIAFRARERGEWRIFINGRIAARGKELSRPALEPRGRSVAFWRGIERGRLRLHVEGPDGPVEGKASDGFIAPGPEAGDPIFSPDGLKTAFWVRGKDGRAAVVRDGDYEPTYAAVGEPVWSPDGRSVAYGASFGPDPELHVMVQGGKETSFLEPGTRDPGEPEGGPRKIVSAWGWRWLAGGSLAWFARLSGGRTCLIRDGRASAEFDSVSAVAQDPEGRRLGFVAGEQGRYAAVVDGSVGPFYDEASFIQFARRGERVAYTARRGTAAFVVADGVPGPAFDRVGWARFTPDGRALAFSALKGLTWVVVLDGRETPFSLKTGMVGNMVLAGPAGRTPVISLREDSGWFVEAGSRRAGPFDSVSHFQWDAAAGTLTFGALAGKEFRLVAWDLR